MAARDRHLDVRRSWLVGLFVLAVFVHIESLTYWFVSTDTFALIHSSRVTSTGDLLALFTEPMMDGTRFTAIALFYRPLASLTTAVDYALWGLDPIGYHATNLVLHGLVVVLGALAVATITRRPAVGLVTGGLVALHPLPVELVPVIARRHDSVMLVFLLASLVLFVRSYREGSTRLRRGSLILYGLALVAKEPALLLPGLVGTWVALEEGAPRDLGAVRPAVRAVIPFAIVTAAYLAVRIVVLGSLGGYLERQSLAPGDGPTLVSKYVLSLAYPADAIGAGAAGKGGWILIPLALAGLSVLIVVVAAGETRRTGDRFRMLAVAVFVLAIGSVPALLAVSPETVTPALEVLGYGPPKAELPFAYPYRGPVAPLLGLALIGAAVAGVVWATRGSPTLLDVTDRRALGFFGVWLAAPLGLFYRSGDYAIRSGYPSLIPAMAILAVLLVAGVAGLRQRSRPAPDGAVLIAAVLLLVVPLVAASPILHPYDGWCGTGEVNRLTVTGLEESLADAPADRPIAIDGIPTGIHEQRESFPRVRSLGFLGPGSLEGWFVLQGAGSDRLFRVTETTVLERPPVDADLDTAIRSDGVRVTVRYSIAEANRSPPLIGCGDRRIV